MTDLLAALDSTWPAASMHRAGGWLVREGRGGGKRVSAATVAGEDASATIDMAIEAQAALGQPPLFSLRDGDVAEDEELARRGFRIVDPTVLYEAPLDALTAEPPRHMTSFPIWPPLAIMADLWAESGIGAARQAVMARCTLPKTAILGRVEDRAAGVLYIAIDGDLAMLHALHVAPDFRRKALARNQMRAAAAWARDAGALRLGLAVTEANVPARALYERLGMGPVGRYHYRAG
ncbi:GNAT family N-acetyltransferase [Frigidibacter sp. RF13]|uniref:GNAT family N-acetyltransferase n=1 Tax=Frigidibacter sp. RF13 TaxID=2997340 RepID=UPI00226E4F03|nr:GNAT family N-acetyltransferase [Frigidibacter sp. RF13]MCY1126703.1 GNAT family N-acetyltransferase [Frigidibacter sp. RF13]